VGEREGREGREGGREINKYEREREREALLISTLVFVDINTTYQHETLSICEREIRKYVYTYACRNNTHT